MGVRVCAKQRERERVRWTLLVLDASGVHEYVSVSVWVRGCVGLCELEGKRARAMDAASVGCVRCVWVCGFVGVWVRMSKREREQVRWTLLVLDAPCVCERECVCVGVCVCVC